MDKVEIYGENANSLAAILEYIQMPNHPFHAAAKAEAAEFIKAHRAAMLEENRRRMQEQRNNMTEAEWSRIVD